jgi:hypothetical protein
MLWVAVSRSRLPPEQFPFTRSIQCTGLVSYDAVNRNKASIRQLPFISSHSLHVSAPTGHLQVRYAIDVHIDYSYYNGSVVRTQLDVSLWYFIPWSQIHVIKRSIKVVKTLIYTVAGLVYKI